MKNWDATGIFWTLEGRKNMTKKINFFPLFLRQNIRWWRCCFITTKTLSPPITKYKYIIQTTLHFLILSRQLSAFFSVCCQMNSINNVPQRALLSLRTSLAHGCAAAHTVIIFTSLSSLSSALMLSVSLPNFLFFLFFLAPSHFSPLFTNSFLHCSITSRAYLISTLFPSFSQSYSHHFLPPSFYYLPDLNTCIMHSEGKTVGRPVCASNTTSQQDSGTMIVSNAGKYYHKIPQLQQWAVIS